MIEGQLFYITCVFFVDDLGFLTADRSISKIVKTLEKGGKIALKWDTNNAVIYGTNKTKAFLFSKAHWQKLVKLLKIRMRIDRKIAYFKKEVT